MDLPRMRSALRVVAAVSLTALPTACVLYLLSVRLGDFAGAWWAGRGGLLAAVATAAAVAALSLAGGDCESAGPPSMSQKR